MAQLYTADGEVLTGSPSLGDLRLLSADEVGRVDGETLGTRALIRTGDSGFTRVRLLTQQLDDNRVLSVGVATDPLDGVRRRLLEVVLLAAPLLLGVLALGGWLVVRAALRPVDLLTREAAAISSFEEDRLLPAVPGNDEIAALAATFADMLTRLRVAFDRERAFVDDASHELRTPIAVLRGELELALSAKDEPAEQERALRAALGEAERLTRLAEDLLLLARERAGSLVLRGEPVDLVDLAVAEARGLERALGLRIQVSGEPVVVWGDGDRLRQLLGNLARNSASAGAASLDLRITVDPVAATLVVADDGPGFPAELRESAFERFVRGDPSRTSSGAGLGLSIVRAVVVAHGGTVDLGNGGLLGGAVVTVRLPMR
jgi:signal transduction histidine kinase